MDQDLDARLVLVVPPALEIVDPHDGVDIGQEVLFGQEVADGCGDERGAAEPASDEDPEADPARLALHHLQADVVDLDGRPVVRRPRDRDLEPSSARMSGQSASAGQLNWMFCRVVK